MKKQGKRIAALVGVLAVLAAALLLLREPETEKTQTAAEDTTLFSFAAAEITGARIENAGGGYTLTATDGTGTIEGLTGLPVEEKKVKSALSACRKIKYDAGIEDGSTRLAEFGLDAPEASVTVTAAAGTASLSVGSAVPGAETESRYVLYDGGVYIVYKTYLSTFLWDTREFVEKTLTPDKNDTDSPLTPVSATVQTKEGTLSVTVSGTETVGSLAVSAYRMTVPAEYPADASAVISLFDALYGISADETAALLRNGVTASAFGLDTPASTVTLTYTDAAGAAGECTLLLSERDADGGCYAMLSGGGAVFRLYAPAEALFLSDGTPYLSRELPYTPVSSLHRLYLTFAEGESYEICLERDGETEYTVKVNGAETEAASFRNFYYMLISAQLDTVDLSGAAETENPLVMQAEYTALDGSTVTVAFRSISDRTVEAFADGIRRGEMSIRTVNEIEAAAKKLAAGEELKIRI